jgi:hypothetical protein
VASLAGVCELPGVLVVDAQVAERLAASPEPYAAALWAGVEVAREDDVDASVADE